MPDLSSYTGDPTSSPKDEVRFLLGDTDPSDWLLTNAEIAYQLLQTANPLLAAAACCESIVAKFSRDVDKGLGELSVSASQRVTQYGDLASILRRRWRKQVLVVPYVGGLKYSEKAAPLNDPDKVQPNFKIGQDDLPLTSPRGRGGS